MVFLIVLYLVIDFILILVLPRFLQNNFVTLTRTVFLLLFSLSISFFGYGEIINFRFIIIYMLIVVRLVWVLIKSIKQSVSHKRSTLIKPFMQILVLIIVFTPLLMFPVYTLASTGDYIVETEVKQYTFIDYEDPFNLGKDRKINVQYWLPKSIDEKMPLIIFSHGGISFKTSNESLFLELASHGYIVASIDHPSHSLYTKFENDSSTWIDWTYLNQLINENPRKDIENSFTLYQQWMDLRTQDMSSYIDYIKTNENYRTHDLIDFTKIGVVGHSLGGSAALCMGSDISNDVLVVVALESPFMCDIVNYNEDTFVFTDSIYSIPVLNVYTDSIWDRLSTLPQYAQNNYYLQNDFSNIENLYIPNSGHFNLSDLSLSSPILTRFLNGFKTEDNQQILEELNNDILLFLNQHLVD